MKISELPEPYKSLAESRRDKDENPQRADSIGAAFWWDETPEGTQFWNAVYCAKTAADLPPIPSANHSPKQPMKHLIKPLSTALSGAILSHSAVGVAIATEPKLWMVCVLGFIGASMYLYAVCEEAAK